MTAAERLHQQLMDEADRLDKLDANRYHHRAHELRRSAQDVAHAGRLLKSAKEVKS